MATTRVVTNEDYKGNKMFKVYSVDSEGENMPYPLVSIGKKKLQTIINNLEAAKKFIGEEDE